MRVFKEEQRFLQLWLIVLLAFSAIVPLTLTIREYLDKKIMLSNLIWTIVIIIIASSLIFFFKLKTRIDEKGIHYQFFPFHLKFKTFLWNDIKNVDIRKYDAISEYGGWGLNKSFFNKKKGKAITVSGDTGIQIELNSNKKTLIGTLKENEIKRVLETYKHKIS